MDSAAVILSEFNSTKSGLSRLTLSDFRNYSYLRINPHLGPIIITGENGTITKSPEKSKYALDDIVTVTATPNSSYHFTKWSDENTENPRRIVVKEDVTLTATFEGD